jgi:predicted ferric reductase
MGIPLIFSLLHVVLISSDVENSILLKSWMLIFFAAAIVAYIYKRFLYEFVGGIYDYYVESVTDVGNKIIEIKLRPKDRKLKFKPGQFIFVHFIGNISTEKHPYTISSSANEEIIRLSINTQGDYTSKLKNLVVGDKAIVFGPHGFLGGEFEQTKKEQIWIAGGIGVTPYLSRLQSVPDNQKVDFYYLTSTKDQAPYDNEIMQKINGRQNISYCNHCSSINGHLNLAIIKEQVGDIKNKRFYLCGPYKMVESMIEQLQKAGVRQSNIIFEEFDFKS